MTLPGRPAGGTSFPRHTVQQPCSATFFSVTFRDGRLLLVFAMSLLGLMTTLAPRGLRGSGASARQVFFLPCRPRPRVPRCLSLTCPYAAAVFILPHCTMRIFSIPISAILTIPLREVLLQIAHRGAGAEHRCPVLFRQAATVHADPRWLVGQGPRRPVAGVVGYAYDRRLRSADRCDPAHVAARCGNHKVEPTRLFSRDPLHTSK